MTLRVRDDDLVWREVESEFVILHLGSSQYFRVNGSGAVLFRLLIAGTTPVALAEALVETYELPLQQAQQEAAAFVAALRDKQLVEG
jgi:hypothetical protein